jgi:hypothetical protein
MLFGQTPFHSSGSTKGDTAMIREHTVPKELDTFGCRIEPGLGIAQREAKAENAQGGVRPCGFVMYTNRI